MSNFTEWVKEYNLDCRALDENNLNYFEIDGVGRFCLVKEKPDRVFSESLELLLSSQEKALLSDIDYYVFPFGGQFYYTPKTIVKPPQFNLFKYLGKYHDETEIEMPYLGIHGEYELLNGSRMYEDWVKKAKFLGYKTLGICERNTLAGTLPFQLACKNGGLKSVLGEEVVVKLDENTYVDCKLFAQSKTGWENLLFINSEINVFNEKKYVDLEKLKSFSEDLVLVLTPSWLPHSNILLIQDLKKCFDVYFQVDTVEYVDDEEDEKFLTLLKEYFDKYLNIVPPVLINDTYYLDRVDSFIKEELNSISGHKFQPASENQYFKSVKDNFDIFISLFREDDSRGVDLFLEAVKNANKIADSCNFVIETNKRFLPKFSLEGLKPEYQQFNSSEELFWYLIEKGIEEKLSGVDLEPYIERIETEYEVFKEGDLIDYFLILWDIVNFCRDNNILVGLGRGSSPGALTTYLLGITNVDPLRFGLLFERFLNKGRVLKSLPDIDTDIEGLQRDRVKKYVIERYGGDRFCQVGTYTRLQLRASIKDLGRVRGLSQANLNYLNKLIDTTATQAENDHWDDIFLNALEKPQIKAFIREQPELISDIQLILGQPRSSSIHACATIILPKIRIEGDRYPEKTLYNSIPLKMMDGALVSEWEGEFLEKAGYLKEDLLGLLQLDKFRRIINLIKESEGVDVDIYSIPYNDKRVFEYFKKGWNGDVFQFNSPGLTGYCLDVQPETIEDLIAMVAIFRPGPMHVRAHIDYVELKHGKKQPKYDYGLKEVTRETYGLYIYQEQIMKAVQVLGGFSLVEADDVRRAMGHMDHALIQKSKEKFIKGAIERGCPEDEAKEIWHKLEVFASYGFNKSHSTVYAITGYISQWLKVHYPTQYWSTAFQFAKDLDIPSYISELNKSHSKVRLYPPSVNLSGFEIYTDFKTNTIYWSLIRIKNVGQVASRAIVEEREKNGHYYSFSEFLNRSNKTCIDKTVVTCLILSGVFDEMEGITEPYRRYELLQQYYTLSNRKPTEGLNDYKKYNSKRYNYWWVLKQKELSGLGHLDYVQLLQEVSKDFKGREREFIDGAELQANTFSGKRGIVAGVILSFKEKSSKNGVFGEVSIQSNEDEIFLTIWNETWSKYGQQVKKSVGKILIMNGEIGRWKGSSLVQSIRGSKIEIID